MSKKKEVVKHDHDWTEWYTTATVNGKPVSWIRSCSICSKVESKNEDIDLSGLRV
jgi:hypothetical protein